MLWLVTLGQILLAPLTALRLAARFLNPKLHQEFVPEAWISDGAPWSEARAEGGTEGEGVACGHRKLDANPPKLVVSGQGMRVNHIVFVGPTLGEFRIMAALADELLRRDPNLQITYCLRDRRSIEQIQKQNPNARVGYRPVEFLPIATRWVKNVRPDVIVFVEGMRFPILAWTAHLAGTKNVLVNGRAARRQKLHHRLRAPYFRWLFRPFDTLLFQTEDHLRNAAPWIAPSTQALVVGDLKLALPSAPVSPELLKNLAQWLGDGPVLAAGSTADAQEEALVIDAFLLARKTTPCLLLLAPRLPGRAEECTAALQARGLRVSRRTTPTPNADVFLLDTLGELTAAYHLCVAAYVGGFFRGKGHNVLEPISAGIPVTYGPNPGEFAALRTLCETHGVGTPVANADQLANLWIQTLTAPTTRAQVRQNAQTLLQNQSTPLLQTVDEIRSANLQHLSDNPAG